LPHIGRLSRFCIAENFQKAIFSIKLTASPGENRSVVDSSGSTRKEWVLTREGFANFLACLDADSERAGEQYEAIRQRLVKFFDWRGAQFPEECADETINRVIRKIEAGDAIRDPATYCHGVARLVFLEKLKHPETQKVGLEEITAVEPASNSPSGEDDLPRECFDRCLRELPIESRQLILQYYQDEKRSKINNRLALAERLGIPLNALRSRAQRIRDRLEGCITDCLRKNEIGPT